MVAGEASGDLLASHLILALKKRLPQAQFFGIGGPKMQAAGFQALFPAEKLAVRGYAEVLRHYREITGIRRELLSRLLSDPPLAFIGVDAPDFNLQLEKNLKKHGIPAIHYVSPSIWAWRGGRIRGIAQSVSHMLALFPFEEDIYRRNNIPVSYVGHPLADVIPLEMNRAALREKLDIPQDQIVFALLPGSRQSELRFMAETFIETAKCLHQRFPQARFLVPLATRETRDMFEHALYRLSARELPMTRLFGHAHDAMGAADGVLVASGTATLEAALLKKPMVIAYRMSPWSWRLMRRMKYQPWVGLPNILCGRFVVPEFLQDEATPDNLAQALGNLVEDHETCRRIAGTFTHLHDQLRQNSAERAADAILGCLSRSEAWTSAPLAV
ncbi:MAG: lipid-A-disaccharide synthase [Rhodocyclaceae bacterium]|nr:lipid-A-disaccharide synthase [Rhodocyclaceae bacterium]MCW5595020.1 lipid-A-disaccharide synthase [Rhodocyclaceae bacterium]